MSFSLAWILWPLAILVLLVVPLIIWAVKQSRTSQRYAAVGLSQVRQMSDREFERYAEQLFPRLGYRVLMPSSQAGDSGIDLVLVDSSGRRLGLLVRHFNEKVGVEELTPAASGAQLNRCQGVLVVSTVGYSRPARQLAQRTGTYHLWTAVDLLAAAEQAGSASAGSASAASAATPTHAAPPQPEEPQGPPCPRCKTSMKPRAAAGHEIWLCSRFPRCNGAKLAEEVEWPA